LKDTVTQYGSDSKHVAQANEHLGRYYHEIVEISSDNKAKEASLSKSESLYSEASRLFIKYYSLEHPMASALSVRLRQVQVALTIDGKS
jgi:hypothetical protein